MAARLWHYGRGGSRREASRMASRRGHARHREGEAPSEPAEAIAARTEPRPPKIVRTHRVKFQGLCAWPGKGTSRHCIG
jgi:hypothetical protein